MAHFIFATFRMNFNTYKLLKRWFCYSTDFVVNLNDFKILGRKYNKTSPQKIWFLYLFHFHCFFIFSQPSCKWSSPWLSIEHKRIPNKELSKRLIVESKETGLVLSSFLKVKTSVGIEFENVCLSACLFVCKTLEPPGDFKYGRILMKFCILVPWMNTIFIFHSFLISIFLKNNFIDYVYAKKIFFHPGVGSM